MFRIYSNVKIFAHGHLHHKYGNVDEYGRGGYFQENDLLHISVGGTANNRGSSFLFLEKDMIKIKVRDHENGIWKDEFEYLWKTGTTLKLEQENEEAAWEEIRENIYLK